MKFFKRKYALYDDFAILLIYDDSVSVIPTLHTMKNLKILNSL